MFLLKNHGQTSTKIIVLFSYYPSFFASSNVSRKYRTAFPDDLGAMNSHRECSLRAYMCPDDDSVSQEQV